MEKNKNKSQENKNKNKPNYFSQVEGFLWKEEISESDTA